MRRYWNLVPLIALLLLTGAAEAQLRQVAVLDIPGRPGFESVAWAKGYLVMAHDASNTVDVFDPAKRRVIAQVKGMNDPRGIGVDEQAGLVYVANAGDQSIAAISMSNWTVQERIPLQASPDCLLFVPETHTLYIGNWQTQSVSLLRPGQRQPAATVDVGGRPERMIFDPATRQVYVSLEDRGEVATVDEAGKVTHRWKLSASLPTGLALDQQSRQLFVAVRYAVVILNADNGTEIRRVAAPAGTDTLWLDEGSQTLYAGATGGSVNIIKLGDGASRGDHELQTTIRGHTLAYDPVKKFIYMPGGREGRAKLVILKTTGDALPQTPNAPQVARDPALPKSFPGLPRPAAEEAKAK
jgi:DNA-binding beta-propeller fold protein YncE